VYQPSDKGYKGRVIYMPPLQITVLEICFGLKIQKYLLESDVSSIKIGKTQLSLHKLMTGISNKFKVTGDFSLYDLSIPSFITLASSDLIKCKLKLSKYESEI